MEFSQQQNHHHNHSGHHFVDPAMLHHHVAHPPVPVAGGGYHRGPAMMTMGPASQMMGGPVELPPQFAAMPHQMAMHHHGMGHHHHSQHFPMAPWMARSSSTNAETPTNGNSTSPALSLGYERETPDEELSRFRGYASSPHSYTVSPAPQRSGSQPLFSPGGSQVRESTPLQYHAQHSRRQMLLPPHPGSMIRGSSASAVSSRFSSPFPQHQWQHAEDAGQYTRAPSSVGPTVYDVQCDNDALDELGINGSLPSPQARRGFNSRTTSHDDLMEGVPDELLRDADSPVAVPPPIQGSDAAPPSHGAFETYVGGNIADALDHEDDEEGDEVVGITAEGDLIFRRRTSTAAPKPTRPQPTSPVVRKPEPKASYSNVVPPTKDRSNEQHPSQLTDSVSSLDALNEYNTDAAVDDVASSPSPVAVMPNIVRVSTSELARSLSVGRAAPSAGQLGARFEKPHTWRAPTPDLNTPSSELTAKLLALQHRAKDRENDLGVYFADQQLAEAEREYEQETQRKRVELAALIDTSELPR